MTKPTRDPPVRCLGHGGGRSCGPRSFYCQHELVVAWDFPLVRSAAGGARPRGVGSLHLPGAAGTRKMGDGTRAGRALRRWLLTVAGVEPRGDPGHRRRLRAGQRRQLGRQRRSPRSEALLS